MLKRFHRGQIYILDNFPAFTRIVKSVVFVFCPAMTLYKHSHNYRHIQT